MITLSLAPVISGGGRGSSVVRASTLTPTGNLLLIGSKNYQPEIVLPGALASAAAFLRAVLVYRGVLAQNSTVIN